VLFARLVIDDAPKVRLTTRGRIFIIYVLNLWQQKSKKKSELSVPLLIKPHEKKKKIRIHLTAAIDHKPQESVLSHLFLHVKLTISHHCNILPIKIL